MLKKRLLLCAIIVFLLSGVNFSVSAQSTPKMTGDANEDGEINAQDVTKVERIIAAWDTSTAGADANLDGKINSLDITKVERIVAGLDEAIPIVSYRLKGLNFGPYVKEGQNPNYGTVISEEQIRSLLKIIAPYTEWVRTYGSDHGLENVGRVGHEMGLKVAVGAWLSGNLAANEEQISNVVNIAKAGEADMLIVGSEVLLRNDLTEEQLIGYINQVKQAVPGIPVATADTYSMLLAHPAVIAASDVVLSNYYPCWEGVNVDSSVSWLHQKHLQVLAAAGGKQVIVSETGWPSAGDQRGEVLPSPENASFYFLNFISWARSNNVSFFYFEAFDEPWKFENSWGPHWGVWDKDGNMKPGMQDVFDGKTIPDNWSK